MSLKIPVVKVADVPTPSYAHEGDSGVDLYAAETATLQPMERKLVATGLKMEIPVGYEGQVRPKSGLSLNHGISAANAVGTIDSNYRGEIKVPVINFSNQPYTVEQGKKIAQLVIAPVATAVFEQVETLSETTRQEGGFGSTGL